MLLTHNLTYMHGMYVSFKARFPYLQHHRHMLLPRRSLTLRGVAVHAHYDKQKDEMRCTAEALLCSWFLLLLHTY